MKERNNIICLKEKSKIRNKRLSTKNLVLYKTFKSNLSNNFNINSISTLYTHLYKHSLNEIFSITEYVYTYCGKPEIENINNLDNRKLEEVVVNEVFRYSKAVESLLKYNNKEYGSEIFSLLKFSILQKIAIRILIENNINEDGNNIINIFNSIIYEFYDIYLVINNIYNTLYKECIIARKLNRREYEYIKECLIKRMIPKLKMEHTTNQLFIFLNISIKSTIKYVFDK